MIDRTGIRDGAAAIEGGVTRTGPGKDSPEKVKDAARQFEALLVSQILKSAHAAGADGWLGAGEDDSASTAMEMAEEQLAQSVSKSGGFGLAKMIVSGLTRK